jgi:hypothetical protein
MENLRDSIMYKGCLQRDPKRCLEKINFFDVMICRVERVMHEWRNSSYPLSREAGKEYKTKTIKVCMRDDFMTRDASLPVS